MYTALMSKMYYNSAFMISVTIMLICSKGFAYRSRDLMSDEQTDHSTQVVESFRVQSDIRFRFATTQMMSVVRNTGTVAQEVTFDVTLPKEAFIMAFHMMIDGKRYDGEVKDKFAAKKEYQDAVDKGQSAGHIRQVPRHANIFQVAVNIAAGTAVNFTLTYQELLRRRFGMYEHEIHVALERPVKDFGIGIYIQENRPLRYVRTPALRTDDLLTNEVSQQLNDLTLIRKLTDTTAMVLYEPSLEQQGKGLSARFVLQYDVEQPGPAGDILVVDGYFVHLLSPDYVKSSLPKDIIFVLDLSGSMGGEKLSQLKVAMKKILSDLMPEERFNILEFSDSVAKWKSGMMEADQQAIHAAQQHVQLMEALGGTNIHGALLTGLKEMRARRDTERVGMIFFLTDGQATSGVTNPQTILQDVATANEGTIAIYSLAFGDRADFSLLKQISAQNLGFARKIYQASDASLQVSTLYNEISVAAIKDLRITYQNSSVDEFSLTETEFPVVFTGSEIIVSGYLKPDSSIIDYRVEAIAGDHIINISGQVNSTDFIVVVQNEDNKDGDGFFTGPRYFSGILERMWAFLTIKQLLRQQDEYAKDSAKLSKIKAEVVELATKYHLVTPLTSMVVTKPDDQKTSDMEDSAQKDVEMEAMTGSGKGHVPLSKGPTSNNKNTYYDPGITGLSAALPEDSEPAINPGNKGHSCSKQDFSMFFMLIFAVTGSRYINIL